MSRKYDTTKYRKRRKRERLNAIAREHRRQLLEAQYRARWAEVQERAEAVRLADPRRQLVQRMVNVLHARLLASPVYRLSQIASIFGVDSQQILDAMVSGDDRIVKGVKMEETKYTIYVNAFEAGILTGAIEGLDDRRRRMLSNVFKQLIEHKKQIEQDAGVVRTLLPNGMLELKDKDGNVIIRPPYSWEVGDN